jgi:hypothetical protein
MVSVKSLGMLLAAAFLVVACSTSCSATTGAPVGIGTPTPSVNPADSKAVDLRVRLDLLLGEHVMVVAKQAAAAANHNDEYTGYLTLLTTNGTDLEEVIGSSFGNQAATQFKQAWDIQNGYLVDYTIGVVNHNASKSNGAMSGLQNGFVPQFAQVMLSLTRLPADATTQLATQRVLDLKTVLDDELAQSFGRMYLDLHAAYVDGSRIGDALATQIAQLYPDKFPGEPSGKAADVRVSLNAALQEHAYLATMATDAVAGKRAADGAAALGALAGNRQALVTVLGGLLGVAAEARLAELWGTVDAELIVYAGSGDAGTASKLSDDFASHISALVSDAAGAGRDQVLATIKVIDDQRSKSYKQVAGDDHAAASAIQPLADRID